MNIIMNDFHIVSLEQVEKAIAPSVTPSFSFESHEKAYTWVSEVLDRFRYFDKNRTKKEKISIRRYIKRFTTYSRSQVTRLIEEKRKTGTLKYGKGKKRHQFKKIYTSEDARLLAEADNAYRRMSGDAMRAVFRDEYLLYGKKDYERLAKISHGHFYRLRDSDAYREKALTVGRTVSVSKVIGIRKKPRPNGKPGYIRADTVHQGDLEGVKGVYHINLVDEVTQWEILVCVDSITEGSMAYVLAEALRFFPFVIMGFHSDNGGENINGSVSVVLQRLLIEQTKSRSGRCNDNALIESKNGAVVRKHMGHWHIPKYEARKINIFYRDCFNEFLNFHRMCAYPTVLVGENGKKKKIYEAVMTPCQKLLSIPNVELYLKPGVTVESLKGKMVRMSHLEYAKIMHENKQKLFATIKKC
ncbi:MAG: integrase [Candidatus Uhrbacteria bacterium]|nr:integrase [Candidatus Uhrbacteria bacterium]